VVENSSSSSSSSSSPAVKKVPVRIVHSESQAEKDHQQYIVLQDPTPPPQGPHHQGSLVGGPQAQDYSVFCAYTRPTEMELVPDDLPPPPEDLDLLTGM